MTKSPTLLLAGLTALACMAVGAPYARAGDAPPHGPSEGSPAMPSQGWNLKGTVVSTINHPLYDQRRLLMCDLLDADGNDTGDYLIAVDSVYAGYGETVLIIDEGNSARQVVGDPHGPIRAIIVGVVDELVTDGVVHDLTT